MKALNYFSFILVILFAAAIGGCVQYDKFKITEKPFVDKTSVILYIGDGAGERNQIQLNSSPDGKQYVWTSLDPAIATVSQTGLVTAQSEGFAIISVASGDDQTDIDVWVMPWVSLEDIRIVGKTRIITTRTSRFQVVAVPVPQNASEVNIEWTSSNPDAITVYENGWVVCNELGGAFITAKAGEFEKQVEVQAILSEKMSKSNWSIPGNTDVDMGDTGFSSHHLPTYSILYLIDDNLSTFWHTWYSGSNPNYPHWFIIDLGEEVIITHVSMHRRQDNNATGQTGFELFTCTESDAEDLLDPTTWGWESQGEFSFAQNTTAEQKYALAEYPTARYVKVYMDVKFRGSGQYANAAEFTVYRGAY